MKQNKESILLSGDGIISFLTEVYGRPDALFFICCLETPPTEKEMSKPARIQIEKTRLLTAEEIQTIFLPRGYTTGTWNKALVCSSQIKEPILGWIYSESFVGKGPANWSPNI